ncbi:MAG: DinB family protein [Acidobacteria bacterium]|nr:DinB family protein [Acidobacteriota bacterium]
MAHRSNAVGTFTTGCWSVDARTADPELSLGILRGVHQRLVLLLDSLTPDDFTRNALHPEWGPISVDWLLQMYAWHSRHHVGHIGLIR